MTPLSLLFGFVYSMILFLIYLNLPPLKYEGSGVDNVVSGMDKYFF